MGVENLLGDVAMLDETLCSENVSRLKHTQRMGVVGRSNHFNLPDNTGKR